MAADATFGASLNINELLPTSTKTSGTSVVRRNLSQPAIDKLVYDALSADDGLAGLVSGEGISGGYGSSTKTLMAQDFMSKVIGNLALATAEQETKTQTKSKKKVSVICTELNRQGLLPDELYHAGTDHFLALPEETFVGYHIWAQKCVPILSRSPNLARLIAPIAISRYEMITGARRFTFWGAVTIYIAQPICFLIGSIILALQNKEVQDGRFN